MKMKVHRLCIVLLAALAFAATGCDRNNDFTAPAFIHLDAIQLEMPTENPITTEDGFYTADIVAARVLLRYPGLSTLDTLGLFELPFTAPVLFNGVPEFIEVYPAIEQSGSSRALIPYFYKSIHLTDRTLKAGDTLNLGTLTTTYLATNDVMRYELFEPTEGSIIFDSVVIWEPHAAADACSGEGYGRVHVTPSQASVTFSIDEQFILDTVEKALYLELDSRSDLLYSVNLKSAYTEGGAEETREVMRIRPSEKWVHLYVNLGTTFKWFNKNPKFRITFTALNVDGTEGDVRIDNVRLISAHTTSI